MSEATSEWIVCATCGLKAMAVNEGQISASYDGTVTHAPHKIVKREL